MTILVPLTVEVENVTGFHRRLYDALVLLRGYFSAGGLGLTEAELKSSRYFETEKLLQLQTATTENLLDQWYRDRLTEQEKMETTPYGMLYIRAYFHHDSLTVEVIRARDIIPLDPNGLFLVQFFFYILLSLLLGFRR